MVAEEGVMKVPANPLALTRLGLSEAIPCVHGYLRGWKEKAGKIPDPELRRQALSSFETKTFHCEGGALFGLLASERHREVIRFIAAYQTMVDYLDNLCESGISPDPEDFKILHEAVFHALTPGAAPSDYYRKRGRQDDGGYLKALVKTCQYAMEQHPAGEKIQPALHELAAYYRDFQVHKHVRKEDRIPRIKEWFEAHHEHLPEMAWYEFAASSGSTLGIYGLFSLTMKEACSDGLVERVKETYFPWVQGLHILLDYFVDQEEDRLGGDLNFCDYYSDEAEMETRFTHFFRQADGGLSQLPHPYFHRMLSRGILAVYLADRKVDRQKKVRRVARRMIHMGGPLSYFFFFSSWVYRRVMGS
jgi:tetraprenyl-beta-curcumene synthase